MDDLAKQKLALHNGITTSANKPFWRSVKRDLISASAASFSTFRPSMRMRKREYAEGERHFGRSKVRF